MLLDHGLLIGHAVATAWLAGLVWTVQLVVYPGFGEVGRTGAWPRVHQAHTRRMARAVGPVWAVQAVALAGLLLRRPDGIALPLLVAAAVLAALPVLVTVAVSVPMHTRLGQQWDDASWRRLVRTNWWRTASWTAGAVLAAALVAVR